MIHIAICDDESALVDSLKELIRQYGLEKSVEIKITVYYDGLELIEKYDTTIDLIFLDIQMKLLDGLRTAKQLRKLDEGVGIIFLTTLTQYGLEGYKYQALDYIIKPLKYARLKSELDRFLSRRQKEESPFIVVNNDSGKYKILLNSLRYVETFNRNLLFYSEQENIICYKSMKEVAQELAPHGFARCHSGCLVNLSYVKGVKKLEISLITGETLTISQPKRKEFMEQLTEYWGDRL